MLLHELKTNIINKIAKLYFEKFSTKKDAINNFKQYITSFLFGAKSDRNVAVDLSNTGRFNIEQEINKIE